MARGLAFIRVVLQCQSRDRAGAVEGSRSLTVAALILRCGGGYFFLSRSLSSARDGGPFAGGGLGRASARGGGGGAARSARGGGGGAPRSPRSARGGGAARSP